MSAPWIIERIKELLAAVTKKADSSIVISTTSPLQGGGDLSRDRTLSINQGSAATATGNGSLGALSLAALNNTTASGLAATPLHINNAIANLLSQGTVTFPRPTTAVGVGQWRSLPISVQEAGGFGGNRNVLPSGGTWAYFVCLRQDTSDVDIARYIDNWFAGVAAGGSNVSNIHNKYGSVVFGFAWRIA